MDIWAWAIVAIAGVVLTLGIGWGLWEINSRRNPPGRTPPRTTEQTNSDD